VDLVKAFCQVHFGEINGAMAGVSFQDVAEQVVQGVAKLHGFLGRNGEGFLVKAGVRIINNRLGLMVALGDYAHGAEAQVREVGNAVKGEDTHWPTQVMLARSLQRKVRWSLADLWGPHCSATLEGCQEFAGNPWGEDRMMGAPW